MLAVFYLMLDEKNKLESDKITNMIWVKHIALNRSLEIPSVGGWSKYTLGLIREIVRFVG